MMKRFQQVLTSSRSPDINEYIQSLLTSRRMGSQVVFHTVRPAVSERRSETLRPFSEEISRIMQYSGIASLYDHQATAIDRIRSGQHVVVATPTASGKTLIYTLPVLENILRNPDSKALYLFPLKALAQDQLRVFEEMSAFGTLIKPTSAIYDGDTSAWHRRKIREHPPNVLLSNPEMLHLSLLAHHPKWADFFSSLSIVVIDEVHTYRGIMGSHMAQVFRRFRRICRFYGASPTFVFSSATVANPEELAEQLTGLKVHAITESGAPIGKKHVVFVNPVDGPAQTAILLLKAALWRGLRTIVYTQSRKLTELIARWAANSAGQFAERISAYRAGFLPEERRMIESKLSSGELLAVISTSALELGIDIGDLDLCILVGYPGTIVATWQRAGRVGRSGQDSALILIAGEDALDQYFMRNPDDLLNRDPEAAVINPYNADIVKKHLICAAEELPIAADDPILIHPAVRPVLDKLEETGELLLSADGTCWHSHRKTSHRDVDLRGSGGSYTILDTQTEKTIGDIDEFRAFRETHPGAVYLHNSETFVIKHIDIETRTVYATKASVDFYTKVRGYKHTEILEVYEHKAVFGTRFSFGRLKVTDQVTGYEKWLIRGARRVNDIPLDLPPQIFETEGLWFEISPEIQKTVEADHHHFMGGIHAVEHAAIGIFPLLVMTDRNDLGGISTTFHPQTLCAAIFIYDSIAGGAGLTKQAFRRAQPLLESTLRAIQTCPCETGCPSCVHSPKCGSGNRPIDKKAALLILNLIQHHALRLNHTTSIQNYPLGIRQEQSGKLQHSSFPISNASFGVLDIETQKAADEVGGWYRADLMKVSCAVLYDSREDRYIAFLESQIPLLIERLKTLNLIVGFNIKRFDYRVLNGYTDFEFLRLPTLDILEEVKNRLGYRLSLDHLAQHTLGIQKTADGLQALRWWKQGKINEIIEYCTADVKITKELFLYGKNHSYLLFKNKAGTMVRLPVRW